MKTGRKTTGGKYHRARKKKFYELRGQEKTVKLGQEKRKIIRVKGGNKKAVLLSANIANIVDKNKKTRKAKIKSVLETPSDKFLAKQNILTKGTIIETDLGKARITNRPSQEGSVQCVLIE